MLFRPRSPSLGRRSGYSRGSSRPPPSSGRGSRKCHREHDDSNDRERQPGGCLVERPPGREPWEIPMPSLTRFVLRHKALVALFWLAVTVAGVLTVGGTTHRMTNNFSMPGQAFKVDNQIIRTYGNGGSQPPFVPVLTVPAGQQISDRAVAAQAGRIFAAAAADLPHARVADYATTHNPAFITRDGRSTFALVYTPPVTGFGGPDLGPVVTHALDHAAPAGWKSGVTGTQLLANGNGASSSKGTGIVAEAMIGALGALAILAFVYASFLALLPLLIGGISVMATFLLVGGLTEITSISQIVEFL